MAERAAEYVRMSTEHQRYSTEKLDAAHDEYDRAASTTQPSFFILPPNSRGPGRETLFSAPLRLRGIISQASP